MKLRNLLGTLLRSNISRSAAYLCPSGVDTRIFMYICLHTSLLRVYVAHVRSRSWCLAKEVSSFKAEQVTATNIEQNAHIHAHVHCTRVDRVLYILSETNRRAELLPGVCIPDG